MENNENNDSGKTVEELAREALAAIKSHETAQRLKEEREYEEEMKAKEEALKEEVRQKIKRKMRNLEREEAKKPKEPEVDTRFNVSWKSGDDGRGFYYEGVYNEKLTFTIKRGINLYHLYVVDADLMIEAWQKSTCTSVDLSTLKGKADKILKEASDRAEKARKEKEEMLKGMILLAKPNYLSKDGTIKEGVKIDDKFYAPKEDV